MKKNVLIVDDSPSLRKIIRHDLATLPEAVFFEAGTGVEAEEIIQQQAAFGDPIDLVTLDWVMPEMTGIEVLERVRAVEAFKVLPLIIMVTAEIFPEQIEHCQRLGVSGYLKKPFSRAELEAVVFAALGQKKSG